MTDALLQTVGSMSAQASVEMVENNQFKCIHFALKERGWYFAEGLFRAMGVEIAIGTRTNERLQEMFVSSYGLGTE